MALVPLPLQSKNVEILKRAFSNRTSMDVDEVEVLLGWSPIDAWGINSLNEDGDSVISILGGRSTEAVGKELGQWVDLMEKTIKLRGGLPKASVWADTLIKMYQRHSLDGYVEVSDQVNRWFNLAPDEYWVEQGERLIRVAFEKKHWDQVDAILSKGVSANTLQPTKISNYGSANDLPLVVSATDEKIANILVKHNADPLLEINNKTAMDYLEERNNNWFESATIRRDVLKIIRASAEKALAAESPEKALAKKVATLWKVIADSPTWMDIQTAATALDKNLKEARGQFGENMLQWVVLNTPNFVPNVLRMKISDKDWPKKTDNFGLNAFDYLQISFGNSFYMQKEQREKFAKGFAAIAEELSPKTKQDMWDSHERIWKFQAENLLKMREQLANGSRKNLGMAWFFASADGDRMSDFFDKDSLYVKSWNKFSQELATPEGFNRASPFFMEISNKTGVLNIPHRGKHKGRYNSSGQNAADPNFEDFLAKNETHQLTQESKDFILRAYTQDIHNLSHSGYLIINGKEDRAHVLKQMSAWIKEGASLADFIGELESNKTEFAKVFNTRLSESESFRGVWLTEFKPELERAELSRRASMKTVQPKKSTPDLFAL